MALLDHRICHVDHDHCGLHVVLAALARHTYIFEEMRVSFAQGKGLWGAEHLPLPVV